MTNFEEIEREIQEFPKGYSVSSKEQKKTYTIYSNDLKELLRGIFSQWEGGGLEIGYIPNSGYEYKVKQDNEFGVYREIDNFSDELTISSQESDLYATPAASPQRPQKPQSSVSATPVGGWKPKGDYASFKFQKDLKTGVRNFEKTVRETKGGETVEDKETWKQSSRGGNGEIEYINSGSEKIKDTKQEKVEKNFTSHQQVKHKD